MSRGLPKTIYTRRQHDWWWGVFAAMLLLAALGIARHWDDASDARVRLAQAYARGLGDGKLTATEALMPVVLAAYQQGQRDGPDDGAPGEAVRCLSTRGQP